ncbi:hypothetical protein Tco_0334366 [Tanacetum coccineum]
MQVYEQDKVQLSSLQSTTYATHWGGCTASGNSDDGVRDSCLSGLYSAGSDSLSSSESSEHKKGETNGNSGAIGKESYDGSESEEDE